MTETNTFYYSGISPDPPKLVYRTGKTPWVKPTGPEAYREPKKLCGVFGHKINDVWNTVGPEVYDLLDKQDVLWTSIDVVRFHVGRGVGILSPVVLWIGILPNTLTVEGASNSAKNLLDLLERYGITDVDVEYRESIYRRSVGPPLLKCVSSIDSTVDTIGPLTAALGLPIAGLATPHFEGTIGFYLAEGGKSEDILAITARHVLFPENDDNIDYIHTNNSSRKDVLLMGTGAFENLCMSIKAKIGSHHHMVEIYKSQIKMIEGRTADDNEEDAKKDKNLMTYRQLLDRATDAIDDLGDLYERIETNWSEPSERIIGHILHSPAIAVNDNPHSFTKDYAVLKLDKEKFKESFKGNILDLGIKILDSDSMLISKIRPQGFKYPVDGLLPLQDVIPEHSMCHPDVTDSNGEACMYVIKNGLGTGVTIGQATGVFSYVREYFPGETPRTSLEWAILPYDKKSGVFSDKGDSGSVIVDVRGRYGGLLTGGTGKTVSFDVTYATPIWWLLPVIQANGFPDAHLNPSIV